MNKEEHTTLIVKLNSKRNVKVYDLGHNILELYNVLVQLRLTTSKTKRNI